MLYEWECLLNLLLVENSIIYITKQKFSREWQNWYKTFGCGVGRAESGQCLYVVNSWDKNGIVMGQRIKYCYRGGEKN